jgi:hypothetical protein
MTFARGLLAFVSVFVLLTAVGTSVAQPETVLWSENWEGFWILDWSVSGGLWDVGPPSNGPGAAQQGANVAGTVLDANYPVTASTRLIRETSFVVPSNNPRLRFWSWFSMGGGDNARVQIRPVGGAWTTLSEVYALNGCGVWTHDGVDLSAWSDSTVQVSFWFQSINCCSGDDEGPGWFIDEVEVISGDVTFDTDWESGAGKWSANGSWEVGVPTAGPSTAYGGASCAGIRLDGSYCTESDSWLTSPWVSVPAGPNPALRFWHWFHIGGGDNGRVQILTQGGSWTTISPIYTQGCGEWTRPRVDLSDYAGMMVRLRFWFYSRNCCSGADEGLGWYIDEVAIETSTFSLLDNPENWESGMDHWFANTGLWQIGKPTSGPGGAKGFRNAAATVLDGNYCSNHASSLVSPPFLVPAAGLNPRVVFDHWYSFGGGDYGEVYLRVVGEDTWNLVSPRYTGSGGGWSLGSTDILTPWSDQSAQIAFYFYAVNCCSGADEGAGWYLDNILFIGIPVATELATYNAEVDGRGVVLWWEMSDIDEGVEFVILRTDDVDARVDILDASLIIRENMSFTYRDDRIEPGRKYVYDVYADDNGDRKMLFRTEPVGTAAIATALRQNHPNPFNPTTTIQYDVGIRGHVSLIVYDVRGAVVRVLYEGPRAAGAYDAAWDGLDERGRQAPSGLYFYRLRTPGFSETRKMVLLK